MDQESSTKSPEESAVKKRPWNRARKNAASPEGQQTHSSSSGNEESTFLVRVKKGETKAKVLFLNNQKSKGWEGPFDMSLTMDDMVEFNSMAAPQAHTWPASVKETASSSGEEESGGSTITVVRPGPLFPGELDKHLTGKRGAGYRELMASEKKTQAKWEPCTGSNEKRGTPWIPDSK